MKIQQRVRHFGGEQGACTTWDGIKQKKKVPLNLLPIHECCIHTDYTRLVIKVMKWC